MLNDSLKNFITRLKQTKLELDDEQIADMLWLAMQMGVPEQAVSENPAIKEKPLPTEVSTTITTDTSGSSKSIPNEEETTEQDKQPAASVYAEDAQSGRPQGLPFKAPAATALPNALHLARSLRPLMRKVPSQTQVVLDEEATVNSIVEQDSWQPVLCPAPERWLDLELVIEASPLSYIWQKPIEEFQQKVLERQGAFRNIRTWTLQDVNPNVPEGKPRLVVRSAAKTLYRSEDPEAPRPGKPQELVHASGRRLVLLISDCRSSLWRQPPTSRQVDDGGGQSRNSLPANIYDWLFYWGNCGSLVLLQLLPDYFWERSAVGLGQNVQFSTFLPGVPNSQLVVQGLSRRQRENYKKKTIESRLPVIKLPVITLNPDFILRWAAVVAGAGNVETQGILFYPDSLREILGSNESNQAEPSPPTKLDEEAEATRLVNKFLAIASPKAQELAGMMAAAPVSLSVVHLIQANLLKDSTPVHVAEVYMSGMLKKKDINNDTGQPVYDFRPHVRKLLNQAMPTYSTEKVLNVLSEVIAKKQGRTINSFPSFISLLPELLDQDGHNVLSFAEILPEVLRNMGQEYAALADQIDVAKIKVGKPKDLISDDEKSEETGNQTAKAASLTVFCSYSHRDEALRDELGKHLKILEYQGLVASWHDRKILAGDEWDHQINTNLETADIILLLISSDFIASSYCWDIEIQRAMQLHESGQACVIPVILRSVDWTSAPFGKLQAVPRNAQPVTLQPDRDAAFKFVMKQIRQVATELLQKRLQQREQLQEKIDREEFDVFLCHNSVDKEQVKKIGEKLKQSGILPWLDEWELRPGFSWQNALEKQIGKIKAAAVFVGKSNMGPWQNAELQAFLSEFIQGERPVIPVLLHDCDQTPVLPLFLRNMMWVDFRRATPDPMNQLIWGITGKKPQVIEQERSPSPILAPYQFQIGTLKRKIVKERVESPGFLGLGKKEEIVPEVIYEIDRKPGSAELFVEDLGNGIQLEMVKILGGTFQMGSPDNEESRSSDESPHEVTIQPFFLGKFTVTQAQWQAIATLPKVNIDLDPDPAKFKGSAGEASRNANRPVEKISWHEAVEFCDRLSRKTNRKYRLPSEAEWEYACRAGTTTPFHFGETITTDIVNYDGHYTYGSAPEGEYRQKTMPVGSFKIANAFGLYDMHGNVFEWCADHWHENYQGAPTDGSAWITGGDSGERLLRGGSWSHLPRDCRSAYRGRIDADDRDDSLSVFASPFPFLDFSSPLYSCPLALYTS